MKITKIDDIGKPKLDPIKERQEKQKPEEEIEIPIVKPPGLQQPG